MSGEKRLIRHIRFIIQLTVKSLPGRLKSTQSGVAAETRRPNPAVRAPFLWFRIDHQSELGLWFVAGGVRMSNGSVTVVGAGLSGLTAAINLARDGFDVLVLEKEKRHGGRPEFRPDGAAGPFDLRALDSYAGIDISPACKPIENMVVRVFGKRADVRHKEGSHTFMVERGPRSTSLDTLLFDKAVEAGVKFEWGHTFKSPADIARLPDGSIVATGLDVQGFEAMGVPYVPFWGWFAKGAVDDDRTLAWAYIDDFTKDYGFTTQINGSVFALLFQRTKPPLESDKEKFESRVREDGLDLTGWRDLIGGAAPHRCYSNPVLFKNNMIVAGTLAGVMEPVMNFGMLGAMLSGKIAAIAVTDKGKAFEEFSRLTAFYKRSLFTKRLLDRMPAGFRNALWGFAAGKLDGLPAERRNRGMSFVPGYTDF